MSLRRSAGAAVVAMLLLVSPARGQESPPNPLDGAEQIGAGRLTAYRNGDHTLVAIPADAFGKPFIWYTEVVGVPAGMVARGGLEIGSSLARFEQRDGAVYVRDLTTTQNRRSGMRRPEKPGTTMPVGTNPVEGAPPTDPKLRAIDIALTTLETGALIAAFPILASTDDGTVLIDITAAFANDIAAATARGFIAAAGLVPTGIDTSRSYIDRVRVFGQNLNIRSHLTFLAGIPGQAAIGPQPVSIVLGHSIVFLPQTPMAQRRFDRRVGYFTTKYHQYESDRGTAQEATTIIARFRLEKANPSAPVSDPVTPITYYIGPDVPERWRPYVKTGIEAWLPALRAAGFSNAIRVLDAPTPEQDPNWSAEDVGINVIRWVPQEHVNAMGPHVIDPRSGETLSAHVLIWPGVIDYFSQYYFALFGGGVDPEAASLPLPLEKAGGILSYIVAHEVGHTLGLRHNQLASTAYTVAQLRDPAVANQSGPNSSIMAYGRFNYVAQPGDGVTQLWGVVGPYDVAAIRYGYADFGSDPDIERTALAQVAETFTTDRRLYWGAVEDGDEFNRFDRDPRIQVENVGAERVAATRLGIANIVRALRRLDAATGGDERLFAATYDVLLSRHVGLLKSVAKLIAGAMPPLGKGDGPIVRFVPAAEQREAIAYLLGEGVASLQAYKAPSIIERVAVYGGYRAIDQIQADLVADVLNGPNIALLESQSGRNAAVYSPLDLARDVADAVWGDLASAPFLRRALQRGYVNQTRRILDAWAKGPGRESQEADIKIRDGASAAAARLSVETGDDTIYVPWLRQFLPELMMRLTAAARSGASETDRLHFAEMAIQVGRLSKALE